MRTANGRCNELFNTLGASDTGESNLHETDAGGGVVERHPLDRRFVLSITERR